MVASPEEVAEEYAVEWVVTVCEGGPSTGSSPKGSL